MLQKMTGPVAVICAVVISVFFAITLVEAATTIGTSITTGGTLTITGTGTSTSVAGGLQVLRLQTDTIEATSTAANSRFAGGFLSQASSTVSAAFTLGNTLTMTGTGTSTSVFGGLQVLRLQTDTIEATSTAANSRFAGGFLSQASSTVSAAFTLGNTLTMTGTGTSTSVFGGLQVLRLQTDTIEATSTAANSRFAGGFLSQASSTINNGLTLGNTLSLATTSTTFMLNAGAGGTATTTIDLGKVCFRITASDRTVLYVSLTDGINDGNHLLASSTASCM